MKKSIAIAALLLTLFASCNKQEIESKNIEATSQEFTSGDLSKLVGLALYSGDLSYSELDGTIPKQTIQLEVMLELKKECPELKKVDMHDINFTRLLSVAVINLEDENGAKIVDLDIKSEDVLKLKELLQGDEGDSETIVFLGEFHNSKDAPKWFEAAKQFTPYLTADISIEKGTGFRNEDSDEIEQNDEDETANLTSEGFSEDEIDQALERYEDVMGQIIEAFKKTKEGDIDAAVECDKLMKEAKALDAKLAVHKSDFTTSQTARYLKLTKMAIDGMSDNE